jgi:hypothetical protein
MDAKEEAEKLVEKFLDIENKYKEYTDYIQAKQCALICVYKMLSVCEWKDVRYLKEVKQEINKL